MAHRVGHPRIEHIHRRLRDVSFDCAVRSERDGLPHARRRHPCPGDSPGDSRHAQVGTERLGMPQVMGTVANLLITAGVVVLVIALAVVIVTELNRGR